MRIGLPVIRADVPAPVNARPQHFSNIGDELIIEFLLRALDADVFDVVLVVVIGGIMVASRRPLIAARRCSRSRTSPWTWREENVVLGLCRRDRWDRRPDRPSTATSVVRNVASNEILGMRSPLAAWAPGHMDDRERKDIGEKRKREPFQERHVALRTAPALAPIRPQRSRRKAPPGRRSTILESQSRRPDRT